MRSALFAIALLASASGACADDVPSAQSLELVALDRGRVVNDRPVRLAHGMSAPVEFDVPSDALSVQVTAIGTPTRYQGVFGDSRSYAICEWKNGDGTSLVARDWDLDEEANPLFCTSCLDRVSFNRSVVAALAPDASAAHLVPGRHAIRLCARDHEGSETLRLFVHIRRGPEPTTGVLDVHLHFAGDPWTAATAQSSTEFQAILDELESIYGQADITLGDVSYDDVPARYATAAEDGQSRMVSQARPAGHFGVDIYFIHHIDAGLPILAESLTVPGAAVAGTEVSGIVVGVADAQTLGGGRTIGHLLAHELGHYLGLYHTSELIFAAEDAIDDTAPGDTSLLMHAGTQGTTITAEQAALLRRSVFVR